jgi:hypothetical protein
MEKYYNYDYDTIFKYLVRFKRWIQDCSKNYCYMKDIVYLNWFLEVRDFIKNGWNVKELYFWKISLQDLDEIKKSEFLDIKVDDLKIPLFV